MVRRCIVQNCLSTDLTTLVHRFPRKHCSTWQTSLQLHSYSINELLEKYVVCGHHFRITDYRHKESKHLNSTAIPTLIVIPDSEKNLQIQASNPKAKNRSIVITASNIGNPEITPNGKTYSNCVTLRSSSPLQTTIANDILDSKTSFENFHCDGDIIEEEIYMDDEMSLAPNISEVCCAQSQELPQCDSDYLRDGMDDNFTENTSFISEQDFCDINAKTMMDDRLTKYVELIETADETDDEFLLQPLEQSSQESIRSKVASMEMYKNYSRDDLIEQLVAATSRIKELETKLDNIQVAHMSVLQNLNNFNKVLIS